MTDSDMAEAWWEHVRERVFSLDEKVNRCGVCGAAPFTECESWCEYSDGDGGG